MIAFCSTCSSVSPAARGLGAKFQDERYGSGQRVHNPTRDAYRCACCGSMNTSVGSKTVRQGPKSPTP